MSANVHPKARRHNLVTRDLSDEVLVYDLDRHEAHCLNTTATAVWHACDGETTPAGIAFRLSRELGEPVHEDVVWLALDEVGRLNLLEAPVVRPEGISRAQMVRRASLVAAAIALPAALSLNVPSAAAATCNPCGGGPQQCTASCPNCVGGQCQVNP